MSDGTTAVQVSPIPTESEMASIRAFFTNVTNALVNASELSVKVKDLEARFAQLNTDHSAVMARNDELVSSLHEVRSQRDEAQSKLVEVRSSLSNMNAEFDKVVADAKLKSEQIEKLNAENTTLTRQYLDEIDSAEFHRKRANDAEAVLAKLKSALGIVDPPKPEPLPPQAEPHTTTTTSSGMSLPEPVTDPRPLSEAEVASAQPEPEPTTWDPIKF